MNYYKEIKNKLIENENYARIKDYSKERYKVQIYYEIGKILNEAGKCYGDNVIEKYAKRLQEEMGKKYNKSTLFKMRKLYLLCSNLKVAPVVPQLTWSHWLLLMPIKDNNKINYYIAQVKIRNLSKRELQTIIKNDEYERLDNQTKQKLINQEELTIQDSIKNPIIIKIIEL